MSRTSRGSCSSGSARRFNHEDDPHHEGHEGHEVKKHLCFVNFMLFVVLWVSWPWLLIAQGTGRTNIPYTDARPILDALRADLIPAELRALTAAQREATWPEWVSRRDMDIRTRLAAGDEDSVVTF